jgi:serine phosphatase RsbU (regulator of sigma subunit)
MIQVGGDVYGVEPCADGAVIWLADATGHGVAAALCTTLVAILFERAAARTADPADVLTHVNTDLFAIFRGSLVMSAICAHFAEDGTVRVAGAGHPPLLVQHRDGRIESIASRGTLLGVGEKFRGAAEIVRLAAGDRALLFSDGLFGARRSNGERQQHTDIAPAWAGCADLEALAERMRGDSAFDDDVSAILVARLNTTVVSDDTFSRHSYAPPE